MTPALHRRRSIVAGWTEPGRRRFRALAAVCASLWLSACGASLGPLSSGELKQQTSAEQGGRRSVCLISALGSTFSVFSLGLTALTSEKYDIPVDGWQVDEHVRRKVHELVAASFDVRHVQASSSSFASLEKPGALFRNLSSERADIIRKLVYGERCDYILVVQRGAGNYGTTGQSLRGFGIVRSGDGLVVDNVYLFALANLYVYENYSFKMLAEMRLPAANAGLIATLSGPHRKVDAKMWPVPTGSADNPQMKTSIFALLDAALAEAVPSVAKVK